MPEYSLSDLTAGAELPAGVSTIGEGKAQRLLVDSNPESGGKSFRFCFPNVPASNALHLSFRLRAADLQPGRQKWENGRAIIEWHVPETKGQLTWENIPVSSVRYRDEDQVRGIVVQSTASLAIPALRLEHLGLSGKMELSDFRAVVVRQSAWWTLGRWLLLCGFMTWAIALVRGRKSSQGILSLGSAAIWAAMAVCFAVPGPWKIQRPMLVPFDIGSYSPENHQQGESPPDLAINSQTLPPVGLTIPSGELPVQGSFPLRIKLLVASARPVLHAMMLALPAFLIAAFTGRRSAFVLCGLLSIMIELSQWAFGYGFGWDDVLDLCSDAMGICLGVFAWRWLLIWVGKSEWKVIRTFNHRLS
jgi:hypothetical protein